MEEMHIHDNLLLVSVLERFGPPYCVFPLRADRGAPPELRDVASHDCGDIYQLCGREQNTAKDHEDHLCNVVRVVTGHDVIHAERGGAAVRGLPAKDTAKRGVIPSF